MRRLLLAGALAASLALGAAACGSIDPDAAVVNGEAIKVRDLETDVAALVKLNAQPGVTPGVALPSAAVRQILSFEILSLLFVTDTAEPISVDGAAIEAASAELGGDNALGPAWLTAPAEVRERLARASAITNAAQQRSGGQAEYNQKVSELLTAAKVTVNRRYGEWDPTTAQVGSLVPPLTTR